MRPRDAIVPPVVIEVLRLCVIVFLAGLGYQIAVGLGASGALLGPFDAPTVGLALGASLGYVLGGVLARLVTRSVRATERALSGRSAEQLLAGVVGAVTGVLAAAALSWPMLLVGAIQYTGPAFIFVLVTVATLGYRLGLARREGVLSLLGGAASTQRQSAAALPRIVDTSVAVDGRIVDVVRAGFLHGRLLVPEPVLGELQALADSTDDQRRARGRRGLDTLEALRREQLVDIEVIPDGAPEVNEVDGKLVHMTRDQSRALLTLDTNLAKVASLAGCRVMNLHALALALRPPVAAGDALTVALTKPGKEVGQAVGYLDDGTMIVVERARDRIGSEASVVVSSVLVTANGRLVFARLTGDGEQQRPAGGVNGSAHPITAIPRPSDVAARFGTQGSARRGRGQRP